MVTWYQDRYYFRCVNCAQIFAAPFKVGEPNEKIAACPHCSEPQVVRSDLRIAETVDLAQEFNIKRAANE